MKLCIKGARIIDPAHHLDTVGDILIADGRFVQVGGTVTEAVDRVVEADGLCAAPGLVDIHVHLRDPGQTHKEDIFTGTAAAAAGGFTAVCCMPNTTPAADSAEVISYIVEKAKTASARVYPVAAITPGLGGGQLTDFAALKAAGAVALSDDGRPVENDELMKQALIESQKHGLLITSHCEDLAIIAGGIMHKGAISEELGVRGMDRRSEDTITARECLLAERTGARVHIAHVSTAGSVEIIRQAKARGVRVTCETAPHYMTMTDELLRARDADFRMNPPLREPADNAAVVRGVIDGTIDCIITDHAPHAPQEKAVFEKAPNGIIGLETSFAAAHTALVHSGLLTLPQLVEKMSTRPCAVMGLPGGSLAVGAAADLVLFDPNERWTVDVEKLYSRSRNTPYKGRTLIGRVKMTLLGGKVSYEDAR